MRLHLLTGAAVPLLALAACSGEPTAESEQEAGAAATDQSKAGDDTGEAIPAAEATPAEESAQNPPELQPGAEQTAAEPAQSPAAAKPAAAAAAPAAPAPPPMAFLQCRSCHSVEPGKNGIGPSLHGIVGQKAASVPGFNFSPALQKSGITWNRASLDTWLKAPIQMVPGTRMVVGVADAERRKAIIDYLETLE